MFHRSQDKQQGFAKEQRVADAQLASLRQLGLIGPETKGFASAWGGTDPIAAAAAAASNSQAKPGQGSKFTKHYATRPFGGEKIDSATFPEKGESKSTFNSSFPWSAHK